MNVIITNKIEHGWFLQFCLGFKVAFPQRVPSNWPTRKWMIFSKSSKDLGKRRQFYSIKPSSSSLSFLSKHNNKNVWSSLSCYILRWLQRSITARISLLWLPLSLQNLHPEKEILRIFFFFFSIINLSSSTHSQSPHI